MKKTIVAVMVAASAVLSAQAFAAGNSANLTILGKVTDANNSCDVSPAPLIAGGTLTLNDIKASVLQGTNLNTPYQPLAKDIEYEIKDCTLGGAAYNGPLAITVTGDHISSMTDVLTNTASSPAQDSSVTVVNTNWSRVDLTGATAAQTITYSGNPVWMRFKAAYVRTGGTVSEGNVKGVATFTVSY